MSSRKPIFLNPDKGLIDRWLCGGALVFIRAYQYTLSPIIGNSCRFYPSCSHYGAQAFWSRSFFHACRLTASRIIRCNPFCEGGYDPLDSEGKDSDDGSNGPADPS